MRITAPTVIHGNPSPSVGRRLPPPPARATLGRVEVDVVGASDVVVGAGGGVTG